MMDIFLFCRSYYRCTNSKCTVKKRVERSCEDPTIVITTYEGQHCHHTVGFPRGGGGIISTHQPSFTTHQLSPSMPIHFYYPTELNTSTTTTISQPCQPLHDASSPPLLPPTDEGLLGDIVPLGMRNRDERNI